MLACAMSDDASHRLLPCVILIQEALLRLGSRRGR
jgi:hypothetical protein